MTGSIWSFKFFPSPYHRSWPTHIRLWSLSLFVFELNSNSHILVWRSTPTLSLLSLSLSIPLHTPSPPLVGLLRRWSSGAHCANSSKGRLFSITETVVQRAHPVGHLSDLNWYCSNYFTQQHRSEQAESTRSRIRPPGRISDKRYTLSKGSLIPHTLSDTTYTSFR